LITSFDALFRRHIAGVDPQTSGPSSAASIPRVVKVVSATDRHGHFAHNFFQAFELSTSGTDTPPQYQRPHQPAA